MNRHASPRHHECKGPWVSVCLVLMALPLLIPWNVVGAMWNIFALPDTGLLGRMINGLGIEYNFTQQPVAAWLTTVVMDVWHWTPFVVITFLAGLQTVSDDLYDAAAVDGVDYAGLHSAAPVAHALARDDRRQARGRAQPDPGPVSV